MESRQRFPLAGVCLRGKLGEAAHAYGDWQTDNQKHWKACFCGAKVEEAAHSFGEWIVDGDKHYKLCSCGDKEEENFHYFKKWGFEGGQHWEECVCGYKFAQTAHSYGSWRGVGDYHWKECACGSIQQKAAHRLNENNQCTVCGIYYGSEAVRYELAPSKDYYIATSINDTSLSGKIYVAAVYGGKEVKGIGMCAFMGCSAKEIVLPNGIESIGAMAFANCANVTTMALPSTLKEIHNSAFNGCTKLNNVVLPSALTRLEAYAFSGCESLTNLFFVNQKGWRVKTSSENTSYSIPNTVFSQNTAAYLTGKEYLGEGKLNLMTCHWWIET